MTAEIRDRRIAFPATDGVEWVELTGPWSAVTGAGGTGMSVGQEKPPARHEGEVSPAEFTRRMPDDPQEGAGPGAPETVEPVQGREDDGPGGPPQREIGTDED